MSQNPLLQQLVSPVTITPDDFSTHEKAAKKLRLVIETLGVAFQRLQSLVNSDPRMSDTRIAHGVTTMQGDVMFDYATLPRPGEVPYAVDGGRRAIWGSGAAPGPTGGGVGPAVGSYNPLLDGAYHTDTVVQTVSRGSLIYGNATPKWDELVIGAANKVIKSDGTDASWQFLDKDSLVNRTRSVFLGPVHFIQVNGTGMSFSPTGTYPNKVIAMQFVDAPASGPQAVQTIWRVPEDWASGTIDVKLLWRLILIGLGLDNTIRIRLRTLAYSPGSSPTAAATSVDTSLVNPLDYVNAFEDSIGAITVTAGQLVRIVIERDTPNDDTTDTFTVLGMNLTYTADM